jgi:sugar lactone lactonase YvrE
MQGKSCRHILFFILNFSLCVSLWMYSQESLRVGFALFTHDADSAFVVATALFSYSNSNGVLISQAGVAASGLIKRGRILVDEKRAKTGIALVNPSHAPVSVALILREADGSEYARNSMILEAGQHLPRFVYQLFPNLPAGFVGSLTFECDQKLSAITLRQTQNVYEEPLYATLPVINLDDPSISDPMVFPHIAAGDGYSTQIILINGSAQIMKGRLNFIGSEGNPLPLQLAGRLSAEFYYEIPPHGVYLPELGRDDGLASGYAMVTPEPASRRPAGVAIFRVRRDGSVVTEAGVGVSAPTPNARIFVDYAGSYTGVALVNQEDVQTQVTLALKDNYGVPIATATRVLSARGYLASFVHDFFPGIKDGFLGLMDISSTTPLSSITLKLTKNKRSDLVYTTLPVADLTTPRKESTLIFPQIAIGSGFSTRLILINPENGQAASGTLNFYQSDGSALVLPIGDRIASEFHLSLPQGGARQLHPGDTSRVANITLMDPVTQLATKEIAVNEGNTVRPSLLILDTTGMPRDDFETTLSSLSQDIASVDPSGIIAGRKAGFSTLVISAGGAIATATITVVSVRIGIAGFEVNGLVQDQARRLYLAATSEHAILAAEDLARPPQVYAGEKKHPGLKNDLRLQSLFNNPAYLAYDHLQGMLYVSDRTNNIIRKVQPGPLGRVETIAGTGSAGSKDGPANTSEFNAPQGIALDGLGNLWIADTDNHTIRRINLSTGAAKTIAGKAGSAGWADGKEGEARFHSPIGIAIENDVLPGPSFLTPTRPASEISVVVADSANGLIRRVKETGDVETVGSKLNPSPGPSKLRVLNVFDPIPPPRFNNPTGVAVDPAGNLYVTEPAYGRVTTILRNGDIVLAAQASTFTNPSGIVAVGQGKLVVADSTTTAREIGYGEPQIISIDPPTIRSTGGDRITIKGRNFAPDSLVIAGGELATQVEIPDTQTISFVAPPLLSGRTTLTVQNRGGLVQGALIVDAVPLLALARGFITTVAGGTTYVGDGGEATAAGLAIPNGLAIDALGNLYIADSASHRVRCVSAKTGIITTIAGTGQPGYSGDNAPATAARLNFPESVALDAGGNLFIADTGNYRIRRVDIITGKISTVAGGGDPPNPPGDNLLATEASLAGTGGIALDAEGNLFIADTGNHRIRKVDARTKKITTVAGDGRAGYFGDNGPAVLASLNEPLGITLDPEGNLFIADNGNRRVRRVNANSQIISTVAGNGEKSFSGDGTPATSTSLGPQCLALDTGGNLFIADIENNRVRRLNAGSQTITTIAGGGAPPDYLGDNRPATEASLDFIHGIVIDAAGNLFIADTGNERVRKVAAATGLINTFAGSSRERFAGDNGPATAATLNGPLASALDARGNLYIADAENNRVRKVDGVSGRITTFAGTGETTYSGDGELATSAALVRPAAIAFDANENVYIAASGNHNIRRVDTITRIIRTVAGTGDEGYSGDNGPAMSAQLNAPQGIAFDTIGRLFIADTLNNCIRRIDSGQIITTIAAGSLNRPSALAFDASDNLYIADTGNHRIRRIDARTQEITTIAGNGQEGFEDDVAATRATLASPVGLALDGVGNLFIADGNNRIRRVHLPTGIITTVVGTGESSLLGDNGLATKAELSFPFGVSTDSAGNLYISDTFNHRIRGVRGPLY